MRQFSHGIPVRHLSLCFFVIRRGDLGERFSPLPESCFFPSVWGEVPIFQCPPGTRCQFSNADKNTTLEGVPECSSLWELLSSEQQEITLLLYLVLSILVGVVSFLTPEGGFNMCKSLEGVPESTTPFLDTSGYPESLLTLAVSGMAQ